MTDGVGDRVGREEYDADGEGESRLVTLPSREPFFGLLALSYGFCLFILATLEGSFLRLDGARDSGAATGGG